MAKKRTRNDGFSEPQRQWILSRDDRMCQLCGAKENGVQFHVHHIIPWRFAMTVLRWTIERVNNPTNGISLCKQCHLGDENSIHPDIAHAARAYHEDKSSYSKVFSERDHLCRKDMPYWNVAYDNKMAVLAVKNTCCYIAAGNPPTPWYKCGGDDDT